MSESLSNTPCQVRDRNTQDDSYSSETEYQVRSVSEEVKQSQDMWDIANRNIYNIKDGLDTSNDLFSFLENNKLKTEIYLEALTIFHTRLFYFFLGQKGILSEKMEYDGRNIFIDVQNITDLEKEQLRPLVGGFISYISGIQKNYQNIIPASNYYNAPRYPPKISV